MIPSSGSRRSRRRRPRAQNDAPRPARPSRASPCEPLSEHERHACASGNVTRTNPPAGTINVAAVAAPIDMFVSTGATTVDGAVGDERTLAGRRRSTTCRTRASSRRVILERTTLKGNDGKVLEPEPERGRSSAARAAPSCSRSASTRRRPRPPTTATTTTTTTDRAVTRAHAPAARSQAGTRRTAATTCRGARRATAGSCSCPK